MTDRAWAPRLAYPLLAAVLLAAPLLPLNTTPRPFATPDILLAVTLAWAARRPGALPAPVVAAVFLLADFLFGRPPGLQAALAIAATEWLRARAPRLARAGFGDEWLAAGGCIVAVMLLNRLALWALVIPTAPIGLTLIQLLVTLAAYPLVAALLAVALGLRRSMTEEVP